MGWAVFIGVLLGVYWCGSSMTPEQREVWNRPFYTIEYNGHTYLKMKVSGSVVHDPDCACREESYE